MDERDEVELYVEAIRALKSELRELLGPEEGARLNRSLGQYLRRARTPEHREQALTRALDRITEHPAARERLHRLLKERGAAEDEARLFQLLPGEDPLIPAGTVVVCPVDPAHLRRRVQYKGQRLRCPLHGVDLVPASEVETDG